MTISKFINSLLICLTLLAFSAQLIIDFSTVNVATSTIILISALSTLLYFRWSKALETHPLSSFAIFGFLITSIVGALLVQSASWLAVSADLYQPLTTFSMLAMYQAIAILSHSLYRVMTTSSSEKPSLLRHMFQSLGVYAIPSVQILWIMGSMGAFFLLFSKFSPVANGFSFLAWSPFLIPVYRQQVGPQYCSSRINYISLVFFTALIAMLAMVFNARGTLLAGIATLALLFLLVAMRSNKRITASMMVKAAAFILVSVALSWPATQLVKAMALTRIDRGALSASAMVAKTIENFLNPDKIEKYNKLYLAAQARTAYNENYIRNPMLARLITTKFHDNAIYFAGKVSDKGAEEMTRVTEDFFWTAFPQPFLDAIKIKVHKDDLRFTMGDMLANFAIGTPLSGLRTGSIFGQGWVLFGYFFPIIYFVMCFIFCAAFDIFATRTAAGVTILSVIGMLNIWTNFLFGITADSLQQLIGGVLRGLPQSLLIYCLAYGIAKVLSNLISKMLNNKPEINVMLTIK